MASKRRAAESFATWFVRRTAVGLAFRNQMTRLFALPFVAERALGAELRDTIEIPDYE